MTSAQHTSDMLEVLDLFARYAWGMDARDEDAYASVWTSDAVWTGNTGTHCEGLDAILASFRRSKSTAVPDTGSAVRLFGHPMVIFDGDTATARTEMVAFRSTGQAVYPYSIGYYVDELRRTDDGWKLSRREMVVSPTMAAPGTS